MNAAEKMTRKIAAQSTDALKDMASKLYADMREGADIVFSAVLDALMARLPEEEFVAFCDAMEA
jgi:hypothetical protein